MKKTILITGSTDGIGKHLAQKFASEGHEVILHGRNPEKLRVALSDVQLQTGNKAVHTYLADFSKKDEVYSFARRIQEDFSRLDVLINNAGAYFGDERIATKEDVEMTFMLSVQVPFILTKELLPLLEKSHQGRVIHTSSYMHHFASVENLDFGMTKDYTASRAYNNAKLYTIWLTCFQAEELKAKGSQVTVNCYHPGLVATNLVNDNVKRSLKSQIKTLDEGIETGYYLSFDEGVATVSGAYFDDKKIKRVSEKGYSQETVAALLRYCHSKT
ncbi:SDR family NAD(P)-dependent oxidoreductase [Streptococcus pneumoniae]